MPQPWEQGNAARQVWEQPSDAPILHAPKQYQPGQPYGWEKPAEPAQPQAPVQSAPPAAAPMPSEPAYMQPPVYEPAPLTPGTPYGADVFDNKPKPFAAAYDLPPWPEEEEAQEEEELLEAPLRDAFAPAEDPKPLKKLRRQPPPKRKLRLGRVLALACAACMIVCCVALGVKMIGALTQSERSFEEARRSYREEHGMELHAGAARVELPPDGQTFAPTAVPTATLPVQTPTPTPVIPVNEAAILSLSGHDANVQEAELTPAPVLRTKQSVYPNNPMSNILPAMAELRTENSDIIGHLVIPGVLDEVVVQRNNTHYLTRSYLGANSLAGAVFADENTSLRLPPENLLLRGQVTVPGKVFAPLLQYVSGGAAFAANASVCTLTTLYEEAQYVLFAVIRADSDPTSRHYFNFASSPTFATDAAMMTYIDQARSRSLYPFGVDVAPSDRLLTLATVGGDSTVILLYRMARANEVY